MLYAPTLPEVLNGGGVAPFMGVGMDAGFLAVPPQHFSQPIELERGPVFLTHTGPVARPSR